MTPATQALYDAATAILRDCRHHTDNPCEVRMSRTETLNVCCACYNAAARTAQLAERDTDCHRMACDSRAID